LRGHHPAPRQLAAINLLAPIPGHPKENVIGADQRPLSIEKQDSDGIGLQHPLQFPLTLPQRFLMPLTFGDVSGDLRGADDLAAGIPYRRNRQRHVDKRAIFAAADGFVMIDAFAKPDALQYSRLFIDALGGHEHGYRSADRFLGGVTENAPRSVVPTDDDAVEALGDNRVVG